MRTWWPVLAPVAALAVNVLGQIVVFRLHHGRHFLRSIVVGFALGGTVLMIAQCIYPLSSDSFESWPEAFLVNVPCYAALSYCFFNFANLGQSSIRVRIYARVAARSDGVSVAEIARNYNEAMLMELRLQRLVESGDLVLRDGRYFLGRARFVPIAKVIFWIKRLVLGKVSEFA
ncbi:MAG: hypothetical protein QOD12_2500 [Verrucomicrobiota bacterium]|jgi:hypothetical protein